MSVAVIVPWRAGCPHRERAWAWVRRKLEATGYPVVVAEAPPGPWIKAEPVNEAIEASDAEVVIVHDADVWSDGIAEAVAAVSQRTAATSWAIPHRGVFRLTSHATERLLNGAEDWEALDVQQPPYLGWEGGGIVAARRETLLEVPMDPRFTGWGQEDEAWAFALNALKGRPWRGRATLVHLYHPPQERADRRKGSKANWRLMMRYQAARNDPDAMRALLEEVTACSLS